MKTLFCKRTDQFTDPGNSEKLCVISWDGGTIGNEKHVIDRPALGKTSWEGRCVNQRDFLLPNGQHILFGIWMAFSLPSGSRADKPPSFGKNETVNYVREVPPLSEPDCRMPPRLERHLAPHPPRGRTLCPATSGHWLHALSMARPGEGGSVLDFCSRPFEKQTQIAKQPGTGGAARPDTRTPRSLFPCLHESITAASHLLGLWRGGLPRQSLESLEYKKDSAVISTFLLSRTVMFRNPLNSRLCNNWRGSSGKPRDDMSFLNTERYSDIAGRGQCLCTRVRVLKS
jgi:hypothetical protein